MKENDKVLKVAKSLLEANQVEDALTILSGLGYRQLPKTQKYTLKVIEKYLQDNMIDSEEFSAKAILDDIQWVAGDYFEGFMKKRLAHILKKGMKFETIHMSTEEDTVEDLDEYSGDMDWVPEGYVSVSVEYPSQIRAKTIFNMKNEAIWKEFTQEVFRYISAPKHIIIALLEDKDIRKHVMKYISINISDSQSYTEREPFGRKVLEYAYDHSDQTLEAEDEDDRIEFVPKYVIKGEGELSAHYMEDFTLQYILNFKTYVKIYWPNDPFYQGSPAYDSL